VKRVDAGRLWAGGLATAVVAALLVIVSVLVARGVFDIPVFAPQNAGVWPGQRATRYTLGAAFGGLAATGLAHLLLLYTPRPMRFFSWAMFLVTAIGVVAPYAFEVAFAVQFTVSALNLVLGVAIGSLVAGSARSAAPRSAAQ
jgi:hypothetical protein